MWHGILDGSVTHSHTPNAGPPDASGGASDAGEGELVDLNVTQDLPQLEQGSLLEHPKDVQRQQGGDVA